MSSIGKTKQLTAHASGGRVQTPGVGVNQQFASRMVAVCQHLEAAGGFCRGRGASRLLSTAETAGQKDDDNNQQNQTQAAAAVNRAAQVKTAAAEQKQQHQQEEYKIHSRFILANRPVDVVRVYQAEFDPRLPRPPRASA
jgi:hypothetical protein